MSCPCLLLLQHYMLLFYCQLLMWSFRRRQPLVNDRGFVLCVNMYTTVHYYDINPTYLQLRYLYECIFGYIRRVYSHILIITHSIKVINILIAKTKEKKKMKKVVIWLKWEKKISIRSKLNLIESDMKFKEVI